MRNSSYSLEHLVGLGGTWRPFGCAQGMLGGEEDMVGDMFRIPNSPFRIS